MLEWLQENWLLIAVPLAVFLAFFIISVWLRRVLVNLFTRWQKKSSWEGSRFIIESLRTPFFHWLVILGAYVAIHISELSDNGKILADKTLATLFTASAFWVFINFSEKLLRHYLSKLKTGLIYIKWLIRFLRVAFIVAGVLIILEIWGAPTTPLILILATVILIAILASRNAILNIFAGFELNRGSLIQIGDYIKTQTGEEGTVLDISWASTRIKSLDNSVVVVPNNKLLQNTIINYGRPLKRAPEPFKFHTRLHLKELTGNKASNITELVKGLKKAPDAVIYYHTHHFLEEHHYLTPEPTNDFAMWVGDVMDDAVLSEKLAGIDTYEFPNIGALRARIVAVMEEYLGTKPVLRNAPQGREFYFVKSVGIIMPTPYAAYDLREFIEILRIISLGSLHFHMFESRLRLGKEINDFSVWLRDDLGEEDLANKITRLDPYNYTLSGLRSAIIQLIEKRIK